MPRKIICGIYIIENILNKKKYIGSAENILNRWSTQKTRIKSIERLKELARNTPREEYQRRARTKRKPRERFLVEKLNELNRNLWKNPDYRTNQIAKRKGKIHSVERRLQQKEITKNLWKDLKFREKMMKSRKKKSKLRSRNPIARVVTRLRNKIIPNKKKVAKEKHYDHNER